MKFKDFRITNFRSILDSGVIKADPRINTLMGQMNQGKLVFLRL